MNAKKFLIASEIEKLENTVGVGQIGVIIQIADAGADACCQTGGCAESCGATCNCDDKGTNVACCISGDCGKSCTNTCY